jgi:flavin reductase (DIM6/NTAB) family NADH-FMN oxidoreductase RutF
MQFDPAALAQKDRYKFLIGGVLPRPIAAVSTLSEDGVANLAAFSFFNAVGSRPMTLQFCPANRADGSEKDSLRNAKPRSEGGRGEFVVNVAPWTLRRKIAATAEELPPHLSEFDLTGLTPAPSVRVAAPRLLESPLSFECRTLQVLRLARGEPGGANLVLGEVVWIHADDAVIDTRLHLDAARLDLIGRMGGSSYVCTRDRFELAFGRAALLDDTGGGS